MSRKSAMDAIFAARPTAPPSPRLEASNQTEPAEVLEASNPLPSPLPPKRIRSGAIAAMGSSLDHLASRAQLADGIEKGSTIIELDTGLIVGSFVTDRVSDASDTSLAGLVDSIRESGQQVPILVRPHPEKPGCYQIAYGHRRARAAAQLGVSVRAVVRDLTDAELVVAQGKENLERRDLSYIERAFFALRLERLSFSREVIGAAMGVHKPDVSNFVTVARTIPEDVVAAIGPAPKVGGPRWRVLAERIKRSGRSRVEAATAKSSFIGLSSNERFAAVFEALEAPAAAKAEKPTTWTDDKGRKLARIERAGQRFNLSIDERLEPAFGDYLVSRLPEILAAYRVRKESDGVGGPCHGITVPESSR